MLRRDLPIGGKSFFHISAGKQRVTGMVKRDQDWIPIHRFHDRVAQQPALFDRQSSLRTLQTKNGFDDGTIRIAGVLLREA